MRQTRTMAALFGAAFVLIGSGSAFGQTFSLDDNPSAPLTSPPMPPFLSAEDPFGLGLPAGLAGLIGPSPSLLHPMTGPFIDGDLLTSMPGGPPIFDVMPPNGGYINAVSADHENVFWPMIQLQFSVDRATGGIPGSALAAEAGFSQQPGDVYTSTASFVHPSVFAGTLVPGGIPGFAGILPTAGGGGLNTLTFDESFFGLTPGLGAGATLPPGVPAPPIMPGTHDNLDAFNMLPTPTLDVTGDMVNDIDYFFSIPIAEALPTGVSPGDIFDVAMGAGGTVPIPYAPAPSMGLDMAGGFSTDDIDALVLWDNNIPLGPAWGGPGGEPGIDYALFSLAPGSMTLLALTAAGIPADPSTIFFTDFTGLYAIYAFGSDLGVADLLMTGEEFANIDALEIIPAPATLTLLGLVLVGARTRRRT